MLPQFFGNLFPASNQRALESGGGPYAFVCVISCFSRVNKSVWVGESCRQCTLNREKVPKDITSWEIEPRQKVYLCVLSERKKNHPFKGKLTFRILAKFEFGHKKVIWKRLKVLKKWKTTSWFRGWKFSETHRGSISRVLLDNLDLFCYLFT